MDLSCQLASASSWNFAVFGDTQNPDGTNGVNTVATTAIATDISTKRNADFALVVGDLVAGSFIGSELQSQYQTFKTAMSAGGLKLAGTGGAGIDYYPIRGNHEYMFEPGPPTVWQAEFGSFLPQNGPTTASGGGGKSEVGMTYSFIHNNALILGLDEYRNQTGGIILDEKPTVNQTWINQQLAANPGLKIFAFGHTAAYKITQADCLAATQTVRNDFLTSLFNAGGVTYFAGHDHLNALARVYDGNPAGTGVQKFYQTVIGSGGAPESNFDGTYNPADYPVTGLYHDSDATHGIAYYYGYGVVTVDDNGLWLKLYGTQDVATSFSLLYTMLMQGAMSVNTGTLSGDINDDAALQFDQTFDGTYTGVISGTGDFVKSGAGTLTLSGTNTYSGGTTISAGTLQVGNPSALGTGAVINNAALSLGTTGLNIGSGAYTQNANSSLNLTVNSPSSLGNITTSGIATVSSGSTVNVTVGGYLPSNTTLTVINGGAGTNISGGASTIVTTTSPFVRFSDALSGNNLILTATRVSNGFQSVASNSNSASVGAVFDGITTPSAEMTPIFNALSGLSASQAAYSENSMTPTTDGAALQSSTAMLNQFVSNVSSRLDNIRTTGGSTGISTGDDYLKGADIWAQGLGDYAHQDPRGLSNGYNATTWGVTGGADIQFYDESKHMGIGSGYGQTFVNSKDFSGTNDIDSVPITLYYSYDDLNRPFYLDAQATFAYNTYTASRRISVGSTEYTANASYHGQQYSGYLEGGYSFLYKTLRLTPLVSFQYAHLHVGSYTESDAGPLNLSVNSQDYDTAQTGLGAKAAYPQNLKCGTLTPDLHFKWLYDWVGDNQATTASFAGGGTSFGTHGFSPAQSGYDFGTKITLATKHNISIDFDYDFLFKENYYEHTGTVNVKYSF